MSPQLNGTSLEEAHSEPHLKPPTLHKSQMIKNETTRDAQGCWVPRSADDYAQLAVRNLVMDMCMQNEGGHGGSALGMAAIGVALWKYIMRYNPSNPDWFDRDRFVLSNGVLLRPFSMVWQELNHFSRSRKYVLVRYESFGWVRKLENK